MGTLTKSRNTNFKNCNKVLNYNLQMYLKTGNPTGSQKNIWSSVLEANIKDDCTCFKYFFFADSFSHTVRCSVHIRPNTDTGCWRWCKFKKNSSLSSSWTRPAYLPSQTSRCVRVIRLRLEPCDKPKEGGCSLICRALLTPLSTAETENCWFWKCK